SGITLAKIAKEFDLSKSTACSIYSKEGRKAVQRAKDELLSPKALVVNTWARPPVIDSMEDILYEWITTNLIKKIPLNEGMVRSKALEIFHFLMDPKLGLFSKDGKRTTKGVPISRVHRHAALGIAYEEDPDDPQSQSEGEFEGFTPRDTVKEFCYIHTGEEIISMETDCNTVGENISETIPMQTDCDTGGETFSMQTECDNVGESSLNIKEYHFNASHSWYRRAIKKRFGLNFKIKQGETAENVVQALPNSS
ncbi:unnamed protein product, partial [Meganyctiphanes norvegica]